MNRREFGWTMIGATLAASVSGRTALAQSSAALQKFSVMLWVLPKPMTMEQRLETVAAAGYNAGEMVTEWRSWSPEQKRSIIAKKNALGLTFDLMFPSTSALTDPAQRPTLAEEIKAAIPIALEIGCPRFSFRSGPRIAGQTPEQQKQSIADGLKTAVDLCRDHRIELILEPIDRIEANREAVNTVADALAITREVNDPSLKVLYDFYHEQRGAGNLIETLEKNFDQVALVHIADVPGRRHPGTGEIDYSNLYRKLAALHYTGYICMEFMPTGDPVAELKAARLQALTAMGSAAR